MKYNLLGRTGLKVSCISLGTVELGMEYGIQRPDKYKRPEKEDAIQLLHYAIEKGINLFDTSPNYGISEELLGKAIGSQLDCYIATKVSIPTHNNKYIPGKKLQQEVNKSLENSLHALRRETLDIVQIHNATAEVMKQNEITDALLNAREAGKIRFIGVSVYGEEAALTAINLGCFDVVQVAYNLLDQRMTQDVFPLAKASGIGIINRSALLKGGLTSRANWLPDELKELCQASERIINTFDITWDILPQMALRFCLSSEFVHAVLVGISSKNELEIAINAALEGPLDDEKLETAKNFALRDEMLLNPSYWSIP